jgi:hypothetical protein
VVVEVGEDGQQRRREERSSVGRRRPAGQAAINMACVRAGRLPRPSIFLTHFDIEAGLLE